MQYLIYIYTLKIIHWSSHCGVLEMNPTNNHEVEGAIPGLAPWVKDLALPQAVRVACSCS